VKTPTRFENTIWHDNGLCNRKDCIGIETSGRTWPHERLETKGRSTWTGWECWNERKEVSNGREELKRKELWSKWTGSVKRKERSNAPGIRVSNIISCYALICSETSCMFYIYIECIDATTQQLLLRLLTGCCYALRSTQLANTLPSLMLRSKICASLFQASTIIDATP